MGDFFVGEIRLFPYNRIPNSWAECNGALLPVQSYGALFALLGTQYGGDGRVNFALPDLRGRVPVGSLPNALGQKQGAEAVALTAAQLPQHSHTVNAYNGVANMKTPQGCMPATPTKLPGPVNPAAPNLYGNMVSGAGTMDPGVISAGGSSAPHDNHQPSLALVYCISVNGIFPPRS